MIASPLTKGFLLLALGVTQQAAAACTRSVTAKQGDTCATIAAETGITVTDFLRSNPAVSSCSALVAGGSYCVAGTADSAPTLQVSTDGTCGNGVTCAGSKFGECCSAHGFCGSTSDYCGDGCQAGFGTCGAGAGTSSAGSCPAGSVTVTVTAGVTRTSLVYQTSTVTNVVTQTRTAATATVTQTVRTTATENVGVTRTSTAIVTLTSLKTATTTQTQTQTQTVKLTSLSIDTITSIVTSTRIVTSVACNTTPTKTTGWLSTTTQYQGGRPTLPLTPNNCRNYDEIREDDNCRSIATRNNLSLLDFYSLNPSVSATVLTLGPCGPELATLVLTGLCQINCDALWTGYFVCVGR